MENEEIYSRIIHYDEVKDIQVRLCVTVFREVEYLSLRKWYRDIHDEWLPSKEGINIPLSLTNVQELFAGLVEILSLAESKDIIIEQFSELLGNIYQ